MLNMLALLTSRSIRGPAASISAPRCAGSATSPGIATTSLSSASSARAASSASAPRASTTRRHERRASSRARARPRPRDAPVISAVSMAMTLGPARPAHHWEMVLGPSSGSTTVGTVRIATWNVNSIKQRMPRLLPWLDQRQPDVVCLQETKLADDAIAELLGEELADRGYEGAVHGEAAWNGVALFSRVGLEDVVRGIADGPGFPNPEARAVSATCGGIRVVSVYVPNGRVPDSDHYRYKLDWLAALRAMVATGPEATVVCGDMNIAPTDDDVFDPDAYIGQTHVTAPERAALAELQELGLRDVVRDRWPDERVFTYWDYRAGMFPKDLGMRIDLDEAPDGNIGPVVPPPSRPVTKRGAKKLPQAPQAPQT